MTKKIFRVMAAGLVVLAAGMVIQREDGGGPSSFQRDKNVSGCRFGEQHSEPEMVSERRESPSMGSAEPFRDDAGSNIQMADGYLYTYWDNCLCRYDPDTLKETVLYEAASSQHGDFCIWGDYVYFMVVPNVSFVGKAHGSLYRVRCDGSDEAVCLTSVKMPGQEDWAGYYQYYTLDTYDDILYLIGQQDDTENLYFRLNQKGDISRAPESETLYGRLPAGYSGWRAGSRMMSLPYSMRNYGYFFVMDEDRRLMRMDAEGKRKESFTALDESFTIPVITNDAILFRDSLADGDSFTWYRISLDEIEEVEEIGQGPTEERFVFCDEDGLYIVCEGQEEWAEIVFMDWEGNSSWRNSFPRTFYSAVDYFDGESYYYTVAANGVETVKRLGMETADEPVTVAEYDRDSYSRCTSRERFTCSWTDEYTGSQVNYEITEIHFTEETGGLGRVNDFLDEWYGQQYASLEEYKETIRRNDSEWSGDGERPINYVEISRNAGVCYMDETYVGVCINDYEYWWGSAHGSHGSDYYMFDRASGRRISITDVVKDSPEEICAIMAPYVEAVAAWGTDEEGWEQMILDEGRFYLSEEGIGLHFDVYEIDSYAAGDREIIVPYDLFDLR